MTGSQDHLITADAKIKHETHGWRAKCLQDLIKFDFPIPKAFALSFSTVEKLTEGTSPQIEKVIDSFSEDALLVVRPSSQNPAWGGPSTILGIGMNDTKCRMFARKFGRQMAEALYLRFIQVFASAVDKLDIDFIEFIGHTDAIKKAMKTYATHSGRSFPQNPFDQLAGVLQSMALSWDTVSARILREAKGAPFDAQLGLVVQEMVLDKGTTECGSGFFRLINPETGLHQLTSQFVYGTSDNDFLKANGKTLSIAGDMQTSSMKDTVPQAYARLQVLAALAREKLCEEIQLEFKLCEGAVYILDGEKVSFTPQGAVRAAVRLAQDGIISSDDAVMRVEPALLNKLLHRQVASDSQRDIICYGIGASPGAATGRIVFTSAQAQASAARDEPCILVRRETTPDDVRGMHAADAVLTERGGLTSHAAVIGRGLGLPCIVGASSLDFRIPEEQLIAEDGRVFKVGDVITIDGSTGQVLVGEPDLVEASLDDSFQTLMEWADEARDIGVRANADTSEDARTARNFRAQGIGLCRTEHMFFETPRLTVMREMIFAETAKRRTEVIERLLPMQRNDFVQLFRIMEGCPVCIRLFDPPLHEFLPGSLSGQQELAHALDIPVQEVIKRVTEMAEYNPMLGLRGVRLGVTVPEIYEMQARAIFEATLEVSKDSTPVIPEIMIPLVSARREVELVKERVNAVSKAVQLEQGRIFDFRLGVMVETPRAALRAEEIADLVDFLSFGTNDLTQMTYGLSRDDAGRFMSDYVRKGVFAEDPFCMLDKDGVGELLRLGVERGRNARPDIILSICGEHGGNTESIAFCRDAGFDYVSCSPFRVPLACLSAAQLTISQKRREKH
ncbi:MAG: PEP-utilizing enzyme [Aestuariivita sp.]|nr:PEP-utilizing enzyme [Aestuariivita sp.]